MELFENIQCPFCGSQMELSIDTSAGSHGFTTDCEVCCRPLQIRVECEPGEILGVDIQPG